MCHENVENVIEKYKPVKQGSANCGILPSRMGEHGAILENNENKEKMENINQIA